MTRNVRLTLSLLAFGGVLFCGNAFGRVRGGVVMNGAEIGGMCYEEAENAVRAQIPSASLCIKTPRGDFSFPLCVRDNVSRLVQKARRGESLTADVQYVWLDAESEMKAVCEKVSYAPRDASVRFSKDGTFEYLPAYQGIGCEYEKSLKAALAAIRDGEKSVELVTRSLYPQITESDLKKQTQLLGTYKTTFNGKNTARKHNIALACTKISGMVLPAGGVFSFNETVGKRTEENGFEVASVILEGEFVPGVGGGVCQVSTTLMNCAVRAGLEITESRPHSLSVSYVPPSCDAMVSDYSDLKIKNPHPYPVYIAAKTGESAVEFKIYGMPDGRRYELESITLLRVSPPPEKVIEGDEDKIMRQEKEGVASESYLLVYEGDALVSRTLFRRDRYAVVQGIKQVKRQSELL